ncbi:hypothetical protein ACI8AF_08030 [Blastococcus sp. SYSU D00669]
MTPQDGRDVGPEMVLEPPVAPAPVAPTPAPAEPLLARIRRDVGPEDVRASLTVVARAVLPVLAVVTVVVAVLSAVVLPDDHNGSLADWLQTAIAVLALALGGRLVVQGSIGIDELATAEASVGLRLVPLVVTVAVLGLVARATARAERAAPSGTTSQLALRSAVTGLVAGAGTGALVLLGSTTAPYGLDLAEEFDVAGSVSTGAGALGSFLGATLLVGLTAAAARAVIARSAGVAVPAAGRTPELRAVLRTLRTFAVGLLATVAVALVLAYLYTAFLTDDLDGARLGVLGGLLLFGVNAVVVLGLGVLGVPAALDAHSAGGAELMELLEEAVEAGAGRSFGLTDQPWLLLALLVPVAVALATAVRRTLRDPGTQVSTASLKVAAGTGAAAALLAAVAVRVAVSGDASASGDPGVAVEISGTAGLSASPSLLWAPLLGAVWAAAVVWALRLGPTLALSLPPRVTRLIAGRRISPVWAAALDGTAPAPAGHRSVALRRAAVATSVAVAVAAVGAAVVAVLNATLFTPQAAAEEYLDALADGDVAAAVVHLADAPDLADQPLLSEAVLGSDSYTGIDHVVIGEVEEHGSSATVAVTYVVGDQPVEDTISLTPGEDRFGLFGTWEVAESLPTLEVWSGSSLGAQIAGTDLADGTYLALPGRYTVSAADHALLTAADAPVVVTTDRSYGATLSPEVKPEALDAARDAVDAAIADCATATELPLENCPFLTGYYWQDELTDVHITVTEDPEYSLVYDESANSLEIVTDSYGSLQLTGTETVEYFFSDPEQRPYETEVRFSVDGEITGSADDLEVTFWD